jgi:hypothetical protein
LAEAKSERFNFDRANDGDSGLSEELMAYGIDRFLTTHTGSLPRPDDLIRAMFAKEEGVPIDRTGLAAKIRAAVAGVVKKAGRFRHRSRQRRRDVEAQLCHLR